MPKEERKQRLKITIFIYNESFTGPDSTKKSRYFIHDYPLCKQSFHYIQCRHFITTDGIRQATNKFHCCSMSTFTNHFLRAFAKLRKETTSYVTFVSLSVRKEQFGTHWTDIHEIWYEVFFSISCRENKFPLKSDNNDYFTWRPVLCIYDNRPSSS